MVPILTSTVPDRVREADESHMVGYARVSMSDQSNQRQVDELVKFGVAACDIFSDTASGKNMDRPGWLSCWRNLQPGDLLVVHSLDRLGRNLEEVIRIERELRETKKVNLKVIAQAELDTRSAAGRLIFHLLMAVAQYEREWSLERTMHGLKLARERGVKGGTEKKYTDEKIIQAMAKHNGNLLKAAREIGASKVTVMRRWKTIEAARSGRAPAATPEPAGVLQHDQSENHFAGVGSD